MTKKIEPMAVPAHKKQAKNSGFFTRNGYFCLTFSELT